MKTRSLLWLLAVAAILVAAAFMLTRGERRPTAIGLAGRPAFPELPLERITTMRLVPPDAEPVELRQGDGIWHVASRFDYPADFNRIAELGRKLAKIKVVQEIAVGPDQHARLELAPPDAADGPGLRCEMRDGDGRLLAGFIAGKMHMKKGDTPETAGQEWPSGRYLLLATDDHVVLVGETLDLLRGDSNDWLDKSFVTASDIKVATLESDGKPRWLLARSSSHDDFVPAAVPDGRTFDKSKADAIGRALNWLRFASIADPATTDADSGLDQAEIFTAETFAGLRYTFRIGRVADDQHFVRVAVAATDIPAPVIPDDVTAEERERREQEHQDKVAAVAQQAAEEQARYSPWLYLFNTNSLTAMTTGTDELFTEKAAEPEPVAEQDDQPPATPEPVAEQDDQPPATPVTAPAVDPAE